MAAPFICYSKCDNDVASIATTTTDSSCSRSNNDDTYSVASSEQQQQEHGTMSSSSSTPPTTPSKNSRDKRQNKIRNLFRKATNGITKSITQYEQTRKELERDHGNLMLF